MPLAQGLHLIQNHFTDDDPERLRRLRLAAAADPDWVKENKVAVGWNSSFRLGTGNVR